MPDEMCSCIASYHKCLGMMHLIWRLPCAHSIELHRVIQYAWLVEFIGTCPLPKGREANSTECVRVMSLNIAGTVRKYGGCVKRLSLFAR